MLPRLRQADPTLSTLRGNSRARRLQPVQIERQDLLGSTTEGLAHGKSMAQTRITLATANVLTTRNERAQVLRGAGAETLAAQFDAARCLAVCLQETRRKRLSRRVGKYWTIGHRGNAAGQEGVQIWFHSDFCPGDHGLPLV